MAKIGPNIEKLYTSYDSIGFMAVALSDSQLAYQMIRGINKHLETNPYTEMCIYVAQKDLPIEIPNCAVYTPMELQYFKGPLIATDPYTWNIARNVVRAEPFYYLYDVALLKFIAPDDIMEMKKSQTRFLSRSKDHAAYVEKTFGIKSDPRYVGDFDVDAIASIVRNK